MATDNPREQVADIMKSTRIAALTYTDDRGRLVSTPMGTQDFEDPATVWFITERDTDKVRHIGANPQVNVHYPGKDGWVSLSGTATVDDDRTKLKELWDASADVFMEGSPEDDNSTLLRVDGDTAEFWESPGKLGMAVGLLKSVTGDERPDLGDTGTVTL